jgi:hypothetical protein
MHMATVNLYIRDSSEPVFEKFKKILEKEKLSMSEVIAGLVEDFVEAKAAEPVEPDEIELVGFSGKKVFEGHTLYWENNSDGETGVFLTARGKIAYWNCIPRAMNPDDLETFEVYENLDQLWEERDWLAPRVRSTIQREYVALTERPIVEHLDI